MFFFYNKLNRKIERLKMKLNELAEALDALTTKVGKIATEVQALKDALTNVDLPAEATEALTRLDAALQGVDDLNPDAPVEPPPPPPVEG